MTKERILAMQPGMEMNIQVAEKVMGQVIIKDETFGYLERVVDPGDGSFVWAPVQPYSEDNTTAELVVDKMINKGYQEATHWADFGEGKYTRAEAICKAALLASLESASLIESSDKILRQALGD